MEEIIVLDFELRCSERRLLNFIWLGQISLPRTESRQEGFRQIGSLLLGR